MVEQVLQQKLQEVQLLTQVVEEVPVEVEALLQVEQVEQGVVELVSRGQHALQVEMEQIILVVVEAEHQLTKVVDLVAVV